MKVNTNIRDNGACPLCRKEENCLILRRIIASVGEFKDKNGTAMELVIYTCPYFVEKV
ncbi:MAG: hypothetical protein P8107_07435 [Spirochaetia bacterium]|jgi:hypothetical protein